MRQEDLHDLPWEHLLLKLFRARTSPLADAENHKFGGLDRRQTDLNDQPAQVARFWRIQFIVHLHVKGLRGGRTKQSTIAPHCTEEGRNIPINTRPELAVIRFKYHPLSTILN